MRRAGRHGAVVLTAVMVCALVVGIVAFAYHMLWRGSARTVFAVQEHRELRNLGRSALAEVYFTVQQELEESRGTWLFWCMASAPAPDVDRPPTRTIDAAAQMSADPDALRYEIKGGNVTLERVVPLTRTSSGDQMGSTAEAGNL